MPMSNLADLSAEHKQISDAVCALYETRLDIMRDYLKDNIKAAPRYEFQEGANDAFNLTLRKFNTLFPEKA